MKPHAFTAAMGFLIAAALVPVSAAQAASADPTGIWRKAEQGERPGKFEIFRCGSGHKYLCAKIVWLQNPVDSRGRPLHDVRNENPSMRDRPILGLPIMTGLVPSGANQWKGNIYNPEDGNTYSVTMTMVSRNQIHVKGCKAWLLCGERTWLRSSLPKKEEPKPEPQIEAGAEPEAEVAAAEPEKAAPQPNALSDAEMLEPVAEQGARAGYRFLKVSDTHKTEAGFSGENIPSMFAMTKPIEGAAAPEGPATKSAPAAAAAAEPKPKPKPQTIQANAAPAPKPQAAPQPQAPQAARPAQSAAVTPQPQSEPDTVETAETDETETAEAATVDPRRLTLRERWRLRRKQRAMQQEAQGGLLWLR
jgi:uncharacterized protein (DUF2147 family)